MSRWCLIHPQISSVSMSNIPISSSEKRKSTFSQFCLFCFLLIWIGLFSFRIHKQVVVVQQDRSKTRSLPKKGIERPNSLSYWDTVHSDRRWEQQRLMWTNFCFCVTLILIVTGRISLLDMVDSLPHNVQRTLNHSLDVCELIKHENEPCKVSSFLCQRWSITSDLTRWNDWSDRRWIWWNNWEHSDQYGQSPPVALHFNL